jgi:hypothetical protein
MTPAANDNETNFEAEHARRLRTIARLARKGGIRPFDVVESQQPERAGQSQ